MPAAAVWESPSFSSYRPGTSLAGSCNLCVCLGGLFSRSTFITHLSNLSHCSMCLGHLCERTIFLRKDRPIKECEQLRVCTWQKAEGCGRHGHPAGKALPATGSASAARRANPSAARVSFTLSSVCLSPFPVTELMNVGLQLENERGLTLLAERHRLLSHFLRALQQSLAAFSLTLTCQ